MTTAIMNRQVVQSLAPLRPSPLTTVGAVPTVTVILRQVASVTRTAKRLHLRMQVTVTALVAIVPMVVMSLTNIMPVMMTVRNILTTRLRKVAAVRVQRTAKSR